MALEYTEEKLNSLDKETIKRRRFGSFREAYRTGQMYTDGQIVLYEYQKIVSSFYFPCYTLHEDIGILQSTAW